MRALIKAAPRILCIFLYHATEAGSHRASGHRIENAPLTEYQMFQSSLTPRAK
jgi:hypothetical protein